MDLDSNYQSPDVTLKFRENERPYIEVRQDHGLILAGWVHPTPQVTPAPCGSVEIPAPYLWQLIQKFNNIVQGNEIIGYDGHNVSIHIEPGRARVVHHTTEGQIIVVGDITWDTNDLKGVQPC
jgi:hypothetical protein